MQRGFYWYDFVDSKINDFEERIKKLEEKITSDNIAWLENKIKSTQLLKAEIATLADEAFDSMGTNTPLCQLSFYQKLRQLSSV
jgi:hypothetical protein